MNSDVYSYLRKQSGLGINPLDTAPTLDTEPEGGNTLPDLDLTDKTSDDTGDEPAAVGAYAKPEALKDSSPAEPAPAPRPSTAPATSQVGAAEVLRRLGMQHQGASAPADPQSQAVWQYLTRKMAAEEDPEARENRRVGNILLIGAGRQPMFELDPKSQVSPDLLQYLSIRNRDDASARTTEQRATSAEQRANIAAERIKMLTELGNKKDVTENRKVDVAEGKAQTYADSVESQNEKRKADLAYSEARTRAINAKLKAAAKTATAQAGQGLTSDNPYIMMDNTKFHWNRKLGNKQVDSASGKLAVTNAARWGQMINLADDLTAKLEAFAREPNATTRAQLLSNSSISAQALVQAIGGGAMQTHEEITARGGLGVNMADLSNITSLAKEIGAWASGDDAAKEEAVQEMTARSRQIRPMAHKLIEGFFQPLGFDAETTHPEKAPSSATPASGQYQKTATGKNGERYGQRPDGKWEAIQ